MVKYLQPTQTEAHINRLTAIKTQLQGYKETDGRAVEAIPAIEAAIGSMQSEPFDPPTVIDGDGADATDTDTPVAGVSEVE